MGKIVDFSHHNGDVNWSAASNELDLAIIRVQYGSKTIDRKYKEYVTGCKEYGIPFGHYAYGCFVSVADAVVEAKDFLNRIDKEARFLVLDVESDTLASCGPSNLAKASQAFIDTCRAAGYKTGFYVSHNLYNTCNLNSVESDFLWIPRYGTNDGQPNKKPDWSCELWQYTEKGKLAGVTGYVDLNMINGSRPLSWFVDEITIAGEEEDIMSQIFNPSIDVLRNGVRGVLIWFEQQDPALSKEWRLKFDRGQLSVSDGLAILFEAINRGYIPRN